MLHIAICDDEPDFVDELQALIGRYASETGLEVKTTVYYDGSELVEKYDTTIDLILFYVKRIEKMDIILITGEKLTISQPKKKVFMERLAEYWGDML